MKGKRFNYQKSIIMFRLLFSGAIVLFANSVFCQTDSIKALKIGDKLPYFNLGNNVLDALGNEQATYSGKDLSSDFKGKLIILDFWTTHCASCISGFKKMSRIQNAFREKVKIFLVNAFENKDQIKAWVSRQQKVNGRSLVPDNLTIIADAKQMLKLFPINGEIGYHVWIDPSGIFRLRGIAENTHEGKIDQLLSGEKICFVQDNALAYNPDSPFFLKNSLPSSIKYASSFGLFDDTNASAYGAGVDNHVDNSKTIVRNTYLNFSISKLYEIAINKSADNKDSFIFGSPLVLDVDNKALVTQDEYTLGRDATDEDFLNKVCYEQIMPYGISEGNSGMIMIDDLNKYLGLTIGLQGKWGFNTVECYKLIFDGDFRKIKSVSNSPLVENKISNFKFSYYYKGYEPDLLFKDYFNRMMQSNYHVLNIPVISGLEKLNRIDIILPDPYKIESLEELKSILQKIGFQLVKTSSNRRMFIIKSETN